VAADNFVASVFRDVGLPDTLVSDRGTRFNCIFIQATLLLVNGVIADVFRSFVSERPDKLDNWPSLIPHQP
jgi:hypothetical protein